MNISKQDRQGARTPSELERRYGFGKSFAEILGIAEEAREAADEVQEKFEGLDQKTIFALLTNNGATKGLYRDENGEIYINASYIAAGIFSSADGKITIDLSGNSEPVFNTGISTNGLRIRADESNQNELFAAYAYKGAQSSVPSAHVVLNSATGNQLMHITETFNADYSDTDGVSAYFRDKTNEKYVAFHAVPAYAGLTLSKGNVIKGSFLMLPDGTVQLVADQISCNVELNVDRINGKEVAWEDLGDGSYRLIGI